MNSIKGDCFGVSRGLERIPKQVVNTNKDYSLSCILVTGPQVSFAPMHKYETFRFRCSDRNLSGGCQLHSGYPWIFYLI